MGAEFVTLAELLRPRAPAVDAGEPAGDGAPPPSAPDAEAGATVDASLASRPADDEAFRNALRDARLFRARLADALDEAVPRLLRELAVRVVARELRLAPCDIEAIVRDVVRRAPAVCIRVAPGESACVREVAVVPDDALDAGDAIVELHGGAVDARLGARIAVVLEELA